MKCGHWRFNAIRYLILWIYVIIVQILFFYYKNIEKQYNKQFLKHNNNNLDLRLKT